MKAMGLTKLELRRERGDMIQFYKLIHGIDDVNWPAVANLTIKVEPRDGRRHSYQLTRELVKSCAPRYNFFNNRIVNSWNSLQSAIAYAPTVNGLKAQIDKFKYNKVNQ